MSSVNEQTIGTVKTSSAKSANGQGRTTDGNTFAATLLAFESEIRHQSTLNELYAHWCNSTRRFLSFRQALIFRRTGNRFDCRVVATSSLAVVDRDAPFIRWIEKVVNARTKQKGFEQSRFLFSDYSSDVDDESETYPFSEFLWTPIADNGEVVGGFLMTRESSWSDGDLALTERMVEVYEHAWKAINGQNSLARKKQLTKLRVGLIAMLLAIAGVVPVPVTALAPASVIADNPYILSSPIDGVIQEIVIEQGQRVSEGDLLVQFEDTDLYNNAVLSRRKELVAAARHERASQGAITSYEAKRELAVAKAQLDLASSERAYADSILEKTTLRSPMSGVAIYTDKTDWEGKPVQTGEAILKIADPDSVQFRIDLPVKDSLVLNESARVKVFLDSDPLNPLETRLTRSSYESRKDARDILSYTLNSEIVDVKELGELPRIGVHGTAQVFSDKAPLAFVLLRRPLAALRQWTGW